MRLHIFIIFNYYNKESSKIEKNTQDSFDRKRLIPFVKSIIINSHNYKRTLDENSYIIALDAAWGSGKSFFIDLLQEDLMQDNTIKSITYNAWKNDFWNNPLEPIMTSIMTDKLFSIALQDRNVDNLYKNAIIAGKELVRGFCLTKAHELFGETAVNNASNSIISGSSEFIKGTYSMFPEYQNYCKTIEDFKTNLKHCLNTFGVGHKLLIIIDELDRCKPLFAIQTLEIVKHFFDVPNIVFLFALDIEQLSHSIKCIYGQKMDSTGYLCRFFNYIVKMPTVNTTDYIRNFLACFVKETALVTSYENKGANQKLYEFVHLLSKAMRFSLRELNTFLENYKIMYYYFLQKYRGLEAHLVYLYLLGLKMKMPEHFHTLLLSTESFSLNLPCINFDNWSVMQSSLISTIKENKTLMNLDGYLYCFKTSDAFKRKFVFNCYADNKFSFFMHNTQSEIISIVEVMPNELIVGMSYVLYDVDFFDWDNIKHLTIRQFLHQRLEMFSFGI